MPREKDIADHFATFVDAVEGRLEGLEFCVGVLMAHLVLRDPGGLTDLVATLEDAAEEFRRGNGYPEKTKLLLDIARGLREAAARPK